MGELALLASGLLSKDAVDRCTAHAEGVGNGACRFTACVHPLRQCGFRGVERLRPPDGLPACASGVARCCATFPTKLQLKFGQAR